jgi:hypothetical protein
MWEDIHFLVGKNKVKKLFLLDFGALFLHCIPIGVAMFGLPFHCQYPLTSK